MLINSNEHILRLNGIQLHYNGLAPFTQHSSVSFLDNKGFQYNNFSPVYSNHDFLMSSLVSQNSSLITTLTPPISPLPPSEERSKRESVIMKVENYQVTSVNDSNQHVCRWEHCFRNFRTLENLANHVNFAHSSVGPNNFYYCKWEGCQRSERGFNARYKMLVHCRTHTKEKPHICSYGSCKKAFSRAENLKIHFRSHTLEKPYRCLFPGCIKAYSNSSDRFKHSRTHQNNKPYMCKVQGCLKRYTDPSSLRKHVKTFNHNNTIQNNDVSMNCDPTLNSYSIGKTSFDFNKFINEPCGRIVTENRSYLESSHQKSLHMNNMIMIEQPLDLSLHHNR